jgi:esterase
VLTDQAEHLQRAAAIAGVDIGDNAGPQARAIIANGIRLSLLEWGASNPQTIVFLHGGGLTAHTWDLVCASLSDRYHCLAVDLRGHGDSEWPANGDYGLDANANDILQLIAAECTNRPVLVGMSLGGLTAFKVAAALGSELAGLVIVDVGPEMRPEGMREIIAFTSADRELPSIEDFVARAMTFNPRRQPELLRRSLQHNLRLLPSGGWTWKWDPRRMQNTGTEAQAQEHAMLWEDIARISVPTLVVRGANSPVLSADDARKLTEAFHSATGAEVPDAGHTVQGDNPKGFLKVIIPFLDGVLPA